MKRILAWACVLAYSLCSSASDVRWPAIKKQQFVFHFMKGKSDFFSVPVLSSEGHPVYRLDCADAEGSKNLPSASDVWTGDLECHLLSSREEHPSYQSLLVAKSDPSVSAGRAVFVAYMLKGKCAAYPDWGLVRPFFLRGMKIVLAVSDVVYEPYSSETHYQGIRSATLTISISPDASATSSLALPSRYAEPKILNPDESDQNKYRVDCADVRHR